MAPPDWTLLVISLPGRRGTTRMRLWRALRALGAAVLRDGVYLLPRSRRAQDALDQQARAVRAAGGEAEVLELGRVTDEQQRTFYALFDRGAEYAGIIARLQKMRAALAGRRTISRQTLATLRREFEAAKATDYFPGPAQAQAAQLLAEVEAETMAGGKSGEPHARRGRIATLERREYRGRVWATRARPWVDRLASAWLIRRFIDPKARILWLKDPKRCPRSALGFDFDGATFTHVGERVTFETLLASFSLESDVALARIGNLVHCLDVGGAPQPEAQGLAAILAGARSRLTDDDALLAESMKIFDNLHTVYSEEPGKTP
jgi:hypothetical protein